MEQVEKQKFSMDYTYVQRLVWALHVRIASSECRPKLILPIYRGGLIPAAMLQYSLATQKQPQILNGWGMASIFAASYKGQYQSGHTVIDIPSWVRAQINKGGDILIVDDIYDTGNTIQHIAYALRESKRKAKIWTAALLTKDVHGVDFFGRLLETEEEKSVWYTFPWEGA